MHNKEYSRASGICSDTTVCLSVSNESANAHKQPRLICCECTHLKIEGTPGCLWWFHFSQQLVSADSDRHCENILGVSVAEWPLCFCILLLYEHCCGRLG